MHVPVPKIPLRSMHSLENFQSTWTDERRFWQMDGWTAIELSVCHVKFFVTLVMTIWLLMYLLLLQSSFLQANHCWIYHDTNIDSLFPQNLHSDRQYEDRLLKIAEKVSQTILLSCRTLSIAASRTHTLSLWFVLCSYSNLGPASISWGGVAPWSETVIFLMIDQLMQWTKLSSGQHVVYCTYFISTL